MLQFFQSDSASGALRSLYDLLRYYVIGVFSKTGFFARKFLEATLGRFGTLRLEFSPYPAMSVPNRFNSIPLIELAIGVYCNVSNAKINTHKVGYFSWRRFVNIATLKQVELPVTEDKIAFTTQPFKEFGLAFSADKWHLLPSSHCPDRHEPLLSFVGHQAFIEGERPQGFEESFGLPVKIVSVVDLGENPDRGIGSHAELSPDFVVANLVQGKLAEYPSIPRHRRHMVGSVISSLKGKFESVKLFWRRKEFQLRNELHRYIIPSIGTLVKKEARANSSAT